MPDDFNQPQQSDSTVNDQLPLSAQVSQSQDQSAPNQPQPQTGQPVTQAQPAPQNPPDASLNAALEQHPANVRAKLMYKIAESLSGGPQYRTTIDPQTGEATKTKIQLSPKDLTRLSLANLLSGFGQVSSNLSDRMAGRRPPQPQALPSQQIQAQRDATAGADFDRVQNQRVRAAKIINSNLESMRLSYALRHENEDALQRTVANSSDELENWNKAGAVEASKIPSSQLLSKGFDKSKYLAVPDGYTSVYNGDGSPVLDKNGVPVSELTYSVVNGTTQAPLSQTKYDQLAKYGLMSTSEGFTLPEGSTVSSAQLALLNSKLSLLQQMESEVNAVRGKVGAPPVDIAAEVQKNKGLIDAIGQYHLGDATESDPNNALQAMRQSKNPKHAQAAPLVSALFGPDVLTRYAQMQQAQKDQHDIDLAGKKKQAEKQGEINAENSPAAIAIQNRKLAAEQSIKQGDPNVAGKLMYDGTLTLSELKTRGATPQFIEGATNAAIALAKANGEQNWTPQVREAQFNTAKSPQNVQFFGSANSLLDKGGTLDQLSSQHAKLGNTSIPLFNKWKDYAGYQAGDPALAGFMQTAIGVADDYAKVMGGGTGSDSSRLQVMQSFSNAHSPRDMQAAVDAARNAVNSQVNARIGTNPVMKQMYGYNLPAQSAGTQSGQQPPARVVPAGATPGRDSSGNIIGYKTADGKVVTF